MPEKKRRARSKCPHKGKENKPVPPPPEKSEAPRPAKWWITCVLDLLKIAIGLANLILNLFKH